MGVSGGSVPIPGYQYYQHIVFWYARVKRMRKVVYDMTAVEVYMYMYSGYSGYK
jgi:hypothetical protein